MRVVIADDNLLVREGVRALVTLEDDLHVVGVAADYDELLSRAEPLEPQVLVTDIRMPPTFQQEGIDAAKQLRKRHPGTGVVVLSQYDDPEYAISLLGDGRAGYAYLLKDRIAEGDQLARAIREVAAGGSMLDPAIVQALVNPVAGKDGDLTDAEDELLRVTGLEDESRGPAAEGTCDRRVVGERGEHEHRRGDPDADQLRGRVDAVEVWHPDVEHRHVRPVRPHQVHGFPPVGGLADDLDVARRGQHRGDPHPDHGLVVGDHDADHRAISSTSTTRSSRMHSR